MSEFLSATAEMQTRREADYAPIDRDTAEILSEYLDEIIAMQESGRSASSTENAFNEWFESSVLLADADLDYAYLWPPTEQRIMLRRICETGEHALGETYQIIMEWSVHRDDLIDPTYSKAYELMVPRDDSEDPKLLMCLQQSTFIRLANGADLTVAVNNSSYHEIDVLLNESFYSKLAMGTQYDAEKLFDELTLFGNMLAAGGGK